MKKKMIRRFLTVLVLFCIILKVDVRAMEAGNTVYFVSETDISTPSNYECEHTRCYWRTSMDITDEKAVWESLMAPITVVSGGEKEQTFLYSQPDASSTPVADVTCASQAIHVLKVYDNGWSLVETYSSSFSNSKIKAWNELKQGYIQTNLLEEKEPKNKEFGLVVDKLTQRLYIFRDGKMIAELYCSTGLATKDGPYNETRSGEFFLLSPVGEFPSGNLLCSYGLRFNAGDMMHEVPHLINADGSKNYRTTEPRLGQRASHGCIRVQRLPNPDGINMRWLWNQIYRGIASKTVKLWIWEDTPTRKITIPKENTPIYYNPDGGSNYHAREICKGVRDKFLPLTKFEYEQLELEGYSNLTACLYCCPPRRIGEIHEINNSYAHP